MADHGDSVLSTRELILSEARRCFAENGYDARHISTDHEEHFHFVPRGRR